MYKELSIKTISIIIAVIFCIAGVLAYVLTDKPDKPTSTTTTKTTQTTTKTTTTKTTTTKTNKTTTTTQSQSVSETLVSHRFVDVHDSTHYFTFTSDGKVSEFYLGEEYTGSWYLNSDLTQLEIHDDLTDSNYVYDLTFDHSGTLISISRLANTYNAI